MLTPDSVIDALGGTNALALALALDPSTVSVWRTRGIPPGRWRSLAKLASDKGVPEITMDALAEIEEARA